jgi:hypothetical protein
VFSRRTPISKTNLFFSKEPCDINLRMQFGSKTQDGLLTQPDPYLVTGVAAGREDETGPLTGPFPKGLTEDRDRDRPTLLALAVLPPSVVDGAD